MLRIVRIQPGPLLAIKPHTQAHLRLKKLTEAGMLVPEDDYDKDTPPELMGRLFRCSMVLCDLEEEIESLAYPKVRRYMAPHFAIPALVIIYICSFQWSLNTADYGDRLWRFGGVWIILGILATGVIVGLVRGQKKRTAERLAALAQARELKKQSLDEFEDLRARFLNQNFAAQIKRRLLVYLADDTWLEQCLREIPMSAAEIRDEILGIRDQISTRLATLAQTPPQSWTSQGLSIDTQAVAQKLRDAEIPRVAPQPTG